MGIKVRGSGFGLVMKGAEGAGDAKVSEVSHMGKSTKSVCLSTSNP